MKVYCHCFYTIIFLFSFVACKSYPPDVADVADVGEIVDCGWDGHAEAWVDDDKDGIWDEGERPLENVLFLVNEISNNYERDAASGVSNLNGEALLSVWLPGCPQVAFEVYAQAPENYDLTSPTRISAAPKANGETFSFGFAYRPGLPTATLRPSSAISCKSYDVKRNSIITDMTIAPDKAIWVTTNDNLVIRFDATDQSRTTFTTQNGIPDEVVRTISVAQDGDVWIGTNEGAARLDGSTWTAYSTTDGTGISSDRVDGIAITSDGAVLFANAFNSVSRFDPDTNSMEMNVVSKDSIPSRYSVDTIRVSPTGSIWFFTQDTIYQQTTSTDLEWVIHKRDILDTLGSSMSIENDASIVISDELIWLVAFGRNGSSIIKLNPHTSIWQAYNRETTNGAMLGAHISSLAIAPDNSLWMGFYEQGVMHFVPSEDESNGLWLYYTTDNGLQSNNIYEILAAPDGSIWLGDDGGSVARCIENR